jgi:glycerol-3-phosphate dehydrogenase (NAD(P)+)
LIIPIGETTNSNQRTTGVSMIVQVIGAGSWGLALARVLGLNGHAVRLWCRPEDKPEELRASRHSSIYLPDISLPENVDVSTEYRGGESILVYAVPSHVMRAVVRQFSPAPDVIRVNVAKGIENDTLSRMSQVIAEVGGPGSVLTLSGPSHAEEVGRGLPATVVAAGPDNAAAEVVQQAFTNDFFRVYTSPDIVGVELGGSLKNVIAIAAGTCDGLGLGDNAKAALITRGLAEMSRLGVAMGADPMTFMGLSGMGDLIVTCESRHSRNRAVGERVASGMSVDDAVSASPMVAEGVRTTKSALALGRKYGVDVPIIEQVHRVLFEGANPKKAVSELMSRDLKPEFY